MSYLGQLLHDLNPTLAILPGILAAYLTYKLSKRKTDRDEWRELYIEERNQLERAKEDIARKDERIDELRDKLYERDENKGEQK